MAAPVNFQRLNPAQIDAAVSYALKIADIQTRAISQAGLRMEGLHMLEIGPGSDFGPALIMASRGVTVTVADRFLADWQDDYHRPLYAKLAEVCPGPVDQLLAAVGGGYEATTLIRVPEAAEDLSSISAGSIDLVYSNAVLEHIVDISAVVKELARITRAGGCGVHQIDLRDHRSFERPLEHLLIPDHDFALLAEGVFYEFGNRVRASEFDAHFAQAGFSILWQDNNMTAEPSYFEDTMRRLESARSVYRNWPRSDLRTISVNFGLRKLSGSQAEQLVTRGEVQVEIIRRLKAATLSLIEQEPLPDLGPCLEFELARDKMVGPDGLLWTVGAEGLPEGDTEADVKSAAVLFEDERPLGPGHSAHAPIRERGRGRYSHWNRQVYFSTSDGTSPVENGRRYVLRVPVDPAE